jgi:hypothetical protein
MLIWDNTVYSVFPSTTLAFTIQKLLASTYIGLLCVDHYSVHILANSHRLFVISDTPGSASPSAGVRGNLSGIVSIVDSKKAPHVLISGTSLLTLDCQSSHFLLASPTSPMWIRGECNAIGARRRLRATDPHPVAGQALRVAHLREASGAPAGQG